MNIIIVEDDSLTALFIKESIEDVGHTVVGSFDNAKTLFKTINTLDIDLAFMDIEIHGRMDGIECATILQKEYDIPCFFITSYQDTTTINDAMGASPLGYLIKPVSEIEIEASLAIASKSLKNISSVKKSPTHTKNNFIFLHKSAKFDTLHHSYFVDDTPVQLSKSESKLLALLSQHKNQDISSHDIFTHVWDNFDKEFSQDSIRTLVKKLRKKLPNDILKNVYGGYYKLVIP